jgi:hypothetical protein
MKGRGFDTEHIYVGVNTMKDFDTVASNTFGVEGVDTGDQEGDVKAMVGYINKRGGVLGRQLVAVFHDTKTSSVLTNYTGAVQASCTHFTQDRPVAAVVDLTLLDSYVLWDCLKKAGIPIFSGLFNMTDQFELDKYSPYRYALGNNRVDTYLPTLIDRQSALGYFKPWDTINGRPGNAPVKVGLMWSDDVPADRRSFAQLERLLTARGIKVVAKVPTTGNNPSQISSAVLRFKSAGVTHVYMTYLGQGLLFTQGAENQNYRPRYAAWAHLSPGVLQQFAPPSQLRGALGAGFRPGTDVGPAGGTGEVSSAAPVCRTIFEDAGLSYRRYSFAETIAFMFCDSFRLYTEATKAANSTLAIDIRDAFGVVGPEFTSASVFRNAFSSKRLDAAGAVRELGYVDSCSCFRYLSTTNHPS